MMRALLVMDTAHETLSLGLLDLDTHATWTLAQSVGNRHGEVFFGALNSLLAQAHATREDIAVVGFGAGPGSFTGLRIACGIAQGLGWALSTPLVPLNNLAIYAKAWAMQANLSRSYEGVVCQDARMGEIYAQRFVADADTLTMIEEPVLVKPDEVSSLFTPSTEVVLGSAVPLYPELGTALMRVESMPEIAAAMLALALKEYEAARTVTPQEAYPIYVRNRVALTIEERARGEKL